MFLDTFDETEYDPLSFVQPRPAPMTAVTGPLSDPLISQRRDRNEEDKTIVRCYTGEPIIIWLELVRPLVPLECPRITYRFNELFCIKWYLRI